MLSKFGILFQNVLYMTVTVEGQWEPFFEFWKNQFPFVSSHNSSRIRMSLKMTIECVTCFYTLKRNKKKDEEKKLKLKLKPHPQNILSYFPFKRNGNVKTLIQFYRFPIKQCKSKSFNWSTVIQKFELYNQNYANHHNKCPNL